MKPFSKKDFLDNVTRCAAQGRMDIAQAHAELANDKTGSLLEENERLKGALNTIAMLGCNELAYSRDFTERVNCITREVLGKKNGTQG
jgi:hypothetical protein